MIDIGSRGLGSDGLKVECGEVVKILASTNIVLG